MNLYEVRPNLIVRTADNLGPTTGMTIKDAYLSLRRPSALGMVQSFVMGHGGHVWWIKHEDGSSAPYAFTEFERVDAIVKAGHEQLAGVKEP